jgi:hypothetical protein
MMAMARCCLILFLSIIGMEFFSSPAGSAGFKFREEPRFSPRGLGSTLRSSVTEQKALEIVSVARERIIVSDFIKAGETFSPEAILKALEERASNIALEQVKKDPKWSFELLTGKLTRRDALWTPGSGEVKLGDVNVYKIIATLFAAPIAACVTADQLDERVSCVREVLDNFGFPPYEPKMEDLIGSKRLRTGPRGMTIESPARPEK